MIYSVSGRSSVHIISILYNALILHRILVSFHISEHIEEVKADLNRPVIRMPCWCPFGKSTNSGKGLEQRWTLPLIHPYISTSLKSILHPGGYPALFGELSTYGPTCRLDEVINLLIEVVARVWKEGSSVGSTVSVKMVKMANGSYWRWIYWTFVKVTAATVFNHLHINVI